MKELAFSGTMLRCCRISQYLYWHDLCFV